MMKELLKSRKKIGITIVTIFSGVVSNWWWKANEKMKKK